MERGEQLMAENQAASERNTAAFERLMEAFDRHEKAFDRHEKAFDRHEKAFDRHEKAFDRHDLAMAKHEKAMGKHEDVMDRVIAALERHEAREDDLKIFLRDQNTRMEKAFRELFRRNGDALAKESRRTDEILAQIREQRAESKAQTEALLRLIDRFPPPAEAA